MPNKLELTLLLLFNLLKLLTPKQWLYILFGLGPCKIVLLKQGFPISALEDPRVLGKDSGVLYKKYFNAWEGNHNIFLFYVMRGR